MPQMNVMWRAGKGWRIEGQMEGKQEEREMNEWTERRRSSPVVRPLPRRCWSSGHPPTSCTETKETRVTAAVTSCPLALGQVQQVMICNSLGRTSPGKRINYIARAVPAVHVGGEWGGGQWMEHFAAHQMFGFLEFGEWSQIVFSPGNFLSDNCWPTAKNSLETQRTCSAEISLPVGAIHGYFRGLWLVKKKKEKKKEGLYALALFYPPEARDQPGTI